MQTLSLQSKMTRPQQVLLETLEKEIREAFSYPKPLHSDDLSEDARIARAFFCYLASVHYKISTAIIIPYLNYGTSESITYTLAWVNREIESQSNWSKVIDLIKNKVNQKCNI